MSAAVAAPRPMFALVITKCVLRLISNCRMSLPVLYLSRFNEATTLNRNYHLSLYSPPPPLPPASIYIVLRISIVSSIILSPTCLFLFAFLPPSPAHLIPDITECRSENKKTSRASGTKVHIHIINPICQEKRLKEKK